MHSTIFFNTFYRRKNETAISSFVLVTGWLNANGKSKTLVTNRHERMTTNFQLLYDEIAEREKQIAHL